MKRFPLELSDEDYEGFFAAYPDYGDRTSLLRKCVRRLIERSVQMHAMIDGVVAGAEEGLKREKGFSR